MWKWIQTHRVQSIILLGLIIGIIAYGIRYAMTQQPAPILIAETPEPEPEMSFIDDATETAAVATPSEPAIQAATAAVPQAMETTAVAQQATPLPAATPPAAVSAVSSDDIRTIVREEVKKCCPPAALKKPATVKKTLKKRYKIAGTSKRIAKKTRMHECDPCQNNIDSLLKDYQ